VLDIGCTNYMTGERRMFTSFKKNECENNCITFDDNSQGQVLSFGKIAITMEHSFSKVLLLNHCTIICYPFHNFVRWITIVYSPIRV
jgi:hypothetical protein